MNRRTFLKSAGAGSVAFLAACNNHPERHLFTLVHAPDDMVTGEESWYASTCRECPAGCGVLAKNREGRLVKLEGNPLHPVNLGKLCARGQAGLQGLYSPDRPKSPLLKKNGQWQPISFDRGTAIVREKLRAAGARGPGRIAMISQVIGDPLLALFGDVLASYGASRPLLFEPLAYESLKYAHAQVLGSAMLPDYHLDRADFLVGFGADFLETWLSPVTYSRRFKVMHGLHRGRKGAYCHVGAYQSLTALNADQWLVCRPGSEAIVAMGLLNRILGDDRSLRGNGPRGGQLPVAVRSALEQLSRAYTPDAVAHRTGVAADAIEHLAKGLLAAEHPLVLPNTAAGSGINSTAADLAAVWLNVVLDPNLALYDVTARHRVEIADDRRTINGFWQKMAHEPVDLLLLHKVDPLYCLPADIPVAQALTADRSGAAMFTVAFGDVMDDTAAAADLVFPVQHPLVGWDLYESRSSLKSVLQPTMGAIDKAPAVGDLFLRLLPRHKQSADTYRQYLMTHLNREGVVKGEADWLAMLQEGGRFDQAIAASGTAAGVAVQGVDALASALDRWEAPQQESLTLQVTPSLRLFDGRSADRAWLEEIPDPITQVAWRTPALVHPDVMAARGWGPGQLVTISTAQGQAAVPVFGHGGLHPELIALPMGQGHRHSGRYARELGINAVDLLTGEVDALTGGPRFTAPVTDVAIGADGKTVPLALTSGSHSQHGRKIALLVPLDEAATRPKEKSGLAMEDFPFTPPLPEGYDHSRDIYPPHDHAGYRWGMVIDLDRCIGCSACVAACYAENNVGVVGETQIVKGREMAWLRIERYADPADPSRSIFLPMLCQHCDNAPCESVCPVFAPHHSKEGLNNQIYNRCIGTRFCAQNCPYKVRRFNWLTWQWPEPLNMQLNPNVTVRSKGVMEKCSFCVQRIKAGHDRAKNEQRAIRDGEVVPACAQTCPTDAIVFGDLMNPESRVRRLMADPRAYQVLGYLNTKPAVIYLKKVVQSI